MVQPWILFPGFHCCCGLFVCFYDRTAHWPEACNVLAAFILMTLHPSLGDKLVPMYETTLNVFRTFSDIL